MLAELISKLKNFVQLETLEGLAGDRDGAEMVDGARKALPPVHLVNDNAVLETDSLETGSGCAVVGAAEAREEVVDGVELQPTKEPIHAAGHAHINPDQ